MGLFNKLFGKEATQAESTESVKLDIKSAIAYVKPDISDEPEGADITLDISDSPVLRDMNNGLYELYLVDMDSHFEYVQGRHLEDSQISAEKLHEIGIYNLHMRTKDCLRVEKSSELYAVFADTNCEASLILIDNLWDQGFAKLVDNEFIACIPSRDVLAFCDSENEQGVEELKAVVERVWENGDHLISESLYKRSNGKWEKLA